MRLNLFELDLSIVHRRKCEKYLKIKKHIKSNESDTYQCNNIK